jgi:hypothetical protein
VANMIPLEFKNEVVTSRSSSKGNCAKPELNEASQNKWSKKFFISVSNILKEDLSMR